VTGHGTEAAQTHLEALRRYPFATVLTPLNPVWRDDTYQTAYLALVDEIRRQDAGADDHQDRVAAQLAGWCGPLAHDVVRAVPPPDPDHRGALVGAGPRRGHRDPHGRRRRLLGMLLEAERNRVSPADAERQLAGDDDYSSPFIAMPF
jgi:hypothetical protein